MLKNVFQSGPFNKISGPFIKISGPIFIILAQSIRLKENIYLFIFIYIINIYLYQSFNVNIIKENIKKYEKENGPKGQK